MRQLSVFFAAVWDATPIYLCPGYREEEEVAMDHAALLPHFDATVKQTRVRVPSGGLGGGGKRRA